ncbi:MAG: aldo/keto reductase, partial [Erysipelotrichaceae bacterium]|nr:aldo/keto reductase [Erysipelotrichaceae bacterium]
WYYAHNMPIFSFSSQAQGFFPRVDAGGVQSLPEDLQKSYASPENLRRLRFAREFAERHSCSLSAVALAYLINNKLTCFPIIGATAVDMLKLSLEAADVEMSAEESDLLYHAPGKRQKVFKD